MGNLFYGLHINKSALRVQTDVLNTAAHNIANANTPGYSRQRVELASRTDSNGPTGLRMAPALKIGSGVESTEIVRSRFALFDEIFRAENRDLNFNQKTEELLNQVELFFDEPSDRSLGGIINEFFNGWLDLSNVPQDIAARQSLYSTANELTVRMKRIYNALVGIRENIDAEILAIPKEINETISEIADLNVAIVKAENQGGSANDLRDKLDLLIDNLSGFANVRAIQRKKGTYAILLGNKVVVEHDAHSELSTITTISDERGLIKTAIVSQDGLEFEPQHGKLGALINFRDTILSSLMDDLDKLAEAIVTTINFEHRIGYGLDGVNNRDFFEPNRTKAFNIEVSSDIKDVTNIAVSIDGAKGDNTNAFNINELKDKRIIDNRFSIKEFYNGFIVNLGVMAREAKSNRMNGELLITQINNSRESVKGVSIDEELVAMIQAQRIYQSAARMIVVMDELLEEIINIV